jgi:hypothetical protein
LELEVQNRAGIVFDNALPEVGSQNAVMLISTDIKSKLYMV